MEEDESETRNTISGGRQEGVVMARDIHGSITFTAAGKQVPAYLQDPGRWPRGGDWDALAAGAHRARPDRGGSAVPPYISRDRDSLVRTKLVQAARDGGLVLVIGDSTAGKTRTCYEALRAELPEHRVLAPATGSDLVAAVEVASRTETRCVMWLDDLETYLGPDGLESGLLAELVRLRIPALATMRLQQYEMFAAPGKPRQPHSEYAQAVAAGARVLRQLDSVELRRNWSAGELERAGESDDDRIADALAHHGPYGVAEYLAAGPALLQEWHHAARPGGHPRAAALISAAVDLVRTGMRPPYSLALLTEVHETYLAAAGGPLLRPEPLDAAVEWATRPRLSVTSMLVPSEDPDAWNVFDYLIDHTRVPVPEATWQAAVQHSTDVYGIGVHADRARAWRIAEIAFRRAAEAGDTRAAIDLGGLLADLGRVEEAERFFRRAAEAGDTRAMIELGGLLAHVGRVEEAATFDRQAAAAGHIAAAFNLGALLAAEDRTEEAESFFRQAAETGDIDAVLHLGVLLADVGRMDEVRSLFRRVAEAGRTASLVELCALLIRTGCVRTAMRIHRQVSDIGDDDAAAKIEFQFQMAGRTVEATSFYRQVACAGHKKARDELRKLA